MHLPSTILLLRRLEDRHRTEIVLSLHHTKHTPLAVLVPSCEHLRRRLVEFRMMRTHGHPPVDHHQEQHIQTCSGRRPLVNGLIQDLYPRQMYLMRS
jgi:hypothetical protein